ncbi:MAG: hypothetical protein K5905_15990 [Roseibium sp.]|uniref:TetR/AcrR family transcriptional regulator n=1 Tax=Roseibium sp. TaxID=1936156 RepID=UPI00260C2B1B|nr:hypothetical protein [Roseibium sp.]MCV0426963.1 hypothetical protein [Roseibium sp.]
MAERRRFAGRPEKTAHKLSSKIILEAALSIARNEGVEAISFRRLSQDLKVTAMAVSYHVGGRHKMLTDLVALAFRGLVGDHIEEKPEANLRRLLSDYCHRALQYSSLVRAMLVDPSLMSSDIKALTQEIRENTRRLNNGDEGDVLLNLLVDYTHGFVFAAAAAPREQSPADEEFLRSLDWVLAKAAP